MGATVHQWLVLTVVMVMACGLPLVVGLWMILESLTWVRASDTAVVHRQDEAAQRAVPTALVWIPDAARPAVSHTCPFPDQELVRVVVGSPGAVWFHPESPHVMRAFSDERPVSTSGVVLVSLAGPLLVAYGLALHRSP